MTLSGKEVLSTLEFATRHMEDHKLCSDTNWDKVKMNDNVNQYNGFFTKCEVKMAGHCPSFFLGVYELLTNL